MNVYQSIVIVGGKGMLAHAIGESLAQHGHSFIGVDLPDYNITRPDDVSRLFKRHRPTLLFNCAAHTKVDLCEDEPDKADAINGHAVALLAEASKEYGTKLLHISTDFVFDGNTDRPYRPEDPVNPLSAYGRSKLLGEQKLREINPPGWIIARTAWLYGRHGMSFPRTIVERARAGQPLRVVNDQFGCPTFTVDLANGLLDLIDHNARGIFHVTNSSVTNWHEFAQTIVNEFGLKMEIPAISTAEFRKDRPKQAIRPFYSALDGSAFAAVTGRPMRPWPQALHDFRLAVEAAGSF